MNAVNADIKWTRNTEVDDKAEAEAVLARLTELDASHEPYSTVTIIFPSEKEQQDFHRQSGWHVYALDHVPVHIDGHALATALGLAIEGECPFTKWPFTTLTTKRKPKIAKGAVSRRDSHILYNASPNYYISAVFDTQANADAFANHFRQSGDVLDGFAVAAQLGIKLESEPLSLLSKGQNPTIIAKCRMLD